MVTIAVPNVYMCSVGALEQECVLGSQLRSQYATALGAFSLVVYEKFSGVMSLYQQHELFYLQR